MADFEVHIDLHGCTRSTAAGAEQNQATAENVDPDTGEITEA